MPAVLDDHTDSWREARLTQTLAQAYENALPPRLFSVVVDHAQRVAQLEREGDAYTFGKRTTYWLPLRDSRGSRLTPLSPIEAAIHQLFELGFGREPQRTRDDATFIAGAEWWVQQQRPRESIGYHYDKDEALASAEMTMRFPEVSTVTYLRERGGPTMVLNQTTPDGNEEIPPLPRRAWISYPRRNKHLLFRGNLQHGVSGELSVWPDDQAHSRMTLLVNWWRDAPKLPNCVRFEAERWRELGMDRREDQLWQLRAATELPRAVSWTALPLEEGRATRTLTLELPPTDIVYFEVPEPLAEGDWAVEWPRERVSGPFARLDLQHRSCVGALFREPLPKLFLVLAARGARHWQGSLPRWLRPMQQQLEAKFRFVLADPADAHDFLGAFGLTTKDAPTMVIHDTAAGVKRALGEPLTKASAWRFVRGFLASQGAHDEL